MSWEEGRVLSAALVHVASSCGSEGSQSITGCTARGGGGEEEEEGGGGRRGVCDIVSVWEATVQVVQ